MDKKEQDRSKGMQKARGLLEHLCKKEKEKIIHRSVLFVTDKANAQESLPEDNSDNLMGYPWI